MKRWLGLLPLALALGCSDLEEGDTIAVGLEVTSPTSSTLEVGEQVQLTARALNANGDVIDAPVTWRTPDATVTVDEATGLVTGVSPGTGRVQASSGSLSSDFLSFSVLAPADTLIIVGDSIVVVPVEPGVTGPLVVRLESFNPAGPLPNGQVTYEITRPAAGAAPVVVLTGDVQSTTATTGSDGTVTNIVLSRVAGTTPPDTAIVEVRATRSTGAIVPGSGQRFIVVFQ
ncbi:MAG: Ig-like domain-containing protein [Gemmatimonadales bacterium]